MVFERDGVTYSAPDLGHHVWSDLDGLLKCTGCDWSVESPRWLEDTLREAITHSGDAMSMDDRMFIPTEQRAEVDALRVSIAREVLRDT